MRYYALGSMQLAIADFSGVCKSSVCRIVPRVTFAICRHAQTYIFMPTSEEERVAAAAAFYHKFARFPRTIGAIDCTHIRIRCPGGENAEMYLNRKHWYSYNVQVVVSASEKILDVVVRWPGRTHDSRIFNESYLKERFEAGEFHGFWLVGYGGCAEKPYMMTPFRYPGDDYAKYLYNESQIRTRNVVERTFGILKRRFPVLSTGMALKLETVRHIVIACCVLHSIAVDNREPEVVLDFSLAEAVQESLNFPENENDDASALRRRQDEPAMRDILVEKTFRPLVAPQYRHIVNRRQQEEQQ